MTNEEIIAGLEYGLILKNIGAEPENLKITCKNLECKSCPFFHTGWRECLILMDPYGTPDVLTLENFKFLEENYPEYLLKV